MLSTVKTPALKKTKLTARQQELLADITVTDNRAVFGGEQIADWKALKAVLEALGGKWKTGKPGGFIFADDIDAAELVRCARATGEIIDPNAHDFFPTPDGLADRIVALAQIEDGMDVLEPSAGKGALVRAVRRAAPAATISCFEILPANVTLLRTYFPSASVYGADFLNADTGPVPDRRSFDRVVMNPPFGKRMDIHHVNHAFSFLKPSGMLSAPEVASLVGCTLKTVHNHAEAGHLVGTFTAGGQRRFTARAARDYVRTQVSHVPSWLEALAAGEAAPS